MDVPAAGSFPVPFWPRSRPLVFARWIGFLLLFGLVGVDYQTGPQTSWDNRAWLPLVTDAVGLTVLLLPGRFRPRWFGPPLRTGLPAAVALAVTALLWVTPSTDEILAPGEAALLLCLLILAVRTCTSGFGFLATALDAVALLTVPLRNGDDPAAQTGSVIALALVGVCSAGLGGYLRFLDHQRIVVVAEVQRRERLVMAADLHDFVAHHVTGILVQTQMARMLATGEAAKLDPVLAGIEQSATESLASMRRLVGVLRTRPDRQMFLDAATWPAGDLAGIEALVERFSRVGPRTFLQRDPSVPDGLPHEIQAAAYRITQEALTNVRRHAADATEVTVGLHLEHAALTVTVINDGHPSARLPESARGGGFGLIGLTERVTALGGELTTGPLIDNGWHVSAHLPIGTQGMISR